MKNPHGPSSNTIQVRDHTDSVTILSNVAFEHQRDIQALQSLQLNAMEL